MCLYLPHFVPLPLLILFHKATFWASSPNLCNDPTNNLAFVVFCLIAQGRVRHVYVLYGLSNEPWLWCSQLYFHRRDDGNSSFLRAHSISFLGRTRHRVCLQKNRREQQNEHLSAGSCVCCPQATLLLTWCEVIRQVVQFHDDGETNNGVGLQGNGTTNNPVIGAWQRELTRKPVFCVYCLSSTGGCSATLPRRLVRDAGWPSQMTSGHS